MWLIFKKKKKHDFEFLVITVTGVSLVFSVAEKQTEGNYKLLFTKAETIPDNFTESFQSFII